MEVTIFQIVHAPLDVYIYLLRISTTSPELGCQLILPPHYDSSEWILTSPRSGKQTHFPVKTRRATFHSWSALDANAMQRYSIYFNYSCLSA